MKVHGPVHDKAPCGGLMQKCATLVESSMNLSWQQRYDSQNSQSAVKTPKLRMQRPATMATRILASQLELSTYLEVGAKFRTLTCH